MDTPQLRDHTHNHAFTQSGRLLWHHTTLPIRASRHPTRTTFSCRLGAFSQQRSAIARPWIPHHHLLQEHSLPAFYRRLVHHTHASLALCRPWTIWYRRSHRLSYRRQRPGIFARILSLHQWRTAPFRAAHCRFVDCYIPVWQYVMGHIPTRNHKFRREA